MSKIYLRFFLVTASAFGAWAQQSPVSPDEFPEMHSADLKNRATAIVAAGPSANTPNAHAAKPNSNALLPLWHYNVIAPRDGNGYFGAMVGKNPFREGGSTSIPTYVVPINFTTNTIADSLDPNTGAITSSHPGVTKFDMTGADISCLASLNNVPLTLLEQSPIFQKTKFSFGGTDVGKTQYIDAFERANYWNVLQDRESYHVLFDPVTVLPALSLNVPADLGVAIPVALRAQGACGSVADVDFIWLYTYLYNTVLPALSQQGQAGPGSLPIFMFYRTGMGFGPDFAGCCFTGIHLANNNSPFQSYIISDFSSVSDMAVVSHELGEWVSDPWGGNPVPLWGHVGQDIGYCQGNLEVGDPLSGTNFPVKMPNGFTYHLQELAFRSWFLGGSSTGVNGWYSNQGTFLTPAATCQ